MSYPQREILASKVLRFAWRASGAARKSLGLIACPSPVDGMLAFDAAAAVAQQQDGDNYNPTGAAPAGGAGGDVAVGVGGGGGGAVAMREGDWKCPICNALVFASKSECFKCRAPKPAGGGAEHPPSSFRWPLRRLAAPGAFVCLICRLSFCF